MRRALMVIALCALSACASPPMATLQPSLANVQLLRAPEIPSLSLGEFKLAAGLPERMDRSITIRASSLRAPEGSFSGYLRQTLEAELNAAGKLDVSAPTTISADLTQSEIDSNSGSGTLGARFIVVRNGATIYDRELSVTDNWQSSFIGGIAIPLAMDRYTALYQRLTSALLSDPDFRRAVSQ